MHTCPPSWSHFSCQVLGNFDQQDMNGKPAEETSGKVSPSLKKDERQGLSFLPLVITLSLWLLQLCSHRGDIIGGRPRKQAENEGVERRRRRRRKKKPGSKINQLDHHPWRLLDRWLINDLIVQTLLSWVFRYLQLNCPNIPAFPRYWKI